MALATLDGVLAGGVARRRLDDHREPALVRLGEHLDARVDGVVGALCTLGIAWVNSYHDHTNQEGQISLHAEFRRIMVLKPDGAIYAWWSGGSVLFEC